MNAYLVDAGEVDAVVEVIDYWARKEPVRLIDLVFAPTRGTAKGMFAHRHRSDIEFTDIKHVRLVAVGVDRARGFAVGNDELWDLTPDMSEEGAAK